MSHEFEQLEQVARFFHGNAAAREFAKADEMGTSTDIPGVDPLDVFTEGKKLPKQGIIVNGRVKKGYEGKIQVFGSPKITMSEGGGHEPPDYYSVGMNFEPSTDLILAYENPNYPFKSIQPYNRMGSSSYTGLAFKDSDIIDLSDGGRGFVIKRALRGAGHYIQMSKSAKEYDGATQVTRFFNPNDREGVLLAVETILHRLIGVQPGDIELIMANFDAKLRRDILPPEIVPPDNS